MGLRRRPDLETVERPTARVARFNHNRWETPHARIGTGHVPPAELRLLPASKSADLDDTAIGPARLTGRPQPDALGIRNRGNNRRRFRRNAGLRARHAISFFGCDCPMDALRHLPWHFARQRPPGWPGYSRFALDATHLRFGQRADVR